MKRIFVCACLVVIVGCSRENSTTKDEATELTLVDVPISRDFDPSEIRAAMGAFRHIDLVDRTIPVRSETHVIANREQLDAFISENLPENMYEEFRTALQTAPIDFSHEAIFLLQQSEGSPATTVRWGIPTLSISSSTRGRELRLRVHAKRSPGRIAPHIEVDYSFPVIVDLSKVDSVSLKIIRSGSFKVGESEAYVAHLNEPNWVKVAIEREKQLQAQWVAEMHRRRDLEDQLSDVFR